LGSQRRGMLRRCKRPLRASARRSASSTYLHGRKSCMHLDENGIFKQVLVRSELTEQHKIVRRVDIMKLPRRESPGTAEHHPCMHFCTGSEETPGGTHHRRSKVVVNPHRSAVIAPVAIHSACADSVGDQSPSNGTPILARVVCKMAWSVTTCLRDASGSANFSLRRSSDGSIDPGSTCQHATTVPLRVMTTRSKMACMGQVLLAVWMRDSTSSLIPAVEAGMGSMWVLAWKSVACSMSGSCIHMPPRGKSGVRCR